MVENEMRSAIVKWLNRSGYYDAHECLVGGYCDVIGCQWSERVGRKKPDLLEMICIELKLRDIKGVIAQAKGNHYHANLSYCAMPFDFCRKMQPKSRQKFIDAGIGLLSVFEDIVEIEILSDYKNKMPHVVFRDRLWNFKLRNDRRNKELRSKR
jgi:hypothetical protein